MTEKNLAEITIHDVDPLALTLLVNFSYTGELSVCEDNVQVKSVIEKVWRFLLFLGLKIRPKGSQIYS